jgi:uncharacterized protein (DUF433 family)
MTARIIDRGRGPEIEGTRITIYDVMDYYKHGWHRDLIAAHFGLGSSQVQAALEYIEENKAAVMEDYQKILERNMNYRYSPEVLAKLAQVRGVATKHMDLIRAQRQKESENGRTSPGP